MKKLLMAGMFAALVGLGGCASVPPESVKLSSTVGQQLLEIKRSHEAYINMVYNQMETQANQAVDNVYGPALIGAALNGASGKILIAHLDAGKNGGTDAQEAILFVSAFLSNIRNKVESQRAVVLQPIKDHHAAALANVDAAWSQVLQGNATITAYLTSLVKLRDTQDQLFAAAGLPDIQTKTADALTEASNDINSITNKAKEKDADLTQLNSDLQNAVDKLKKK